jgi:hypothetical protein
MRVKYIGKNVNSSHPKTLYEHVILSLTQDLFEEEYCPQRRDSASGKLGFPCAE